VHRNIWWGNLRERRQSERVDFDGRSPRNHLGLRAGLIWLRISTGSCCERDSQVSFFIKCGNFFTEEM